MGTFADSNIPAVCELSLQGLAREAHGSAADARAWRTLDVERYPPPSYEGFLAGYTYSCSGLQ